MESSLFYPLDIPYDMAYRKNSPAEPVSPHSHNAVEIYLTRTALPDVLIEDQLYTVEADTLIIIPAFSVHQLYHEMGIEYERYVLSIKDSWIKNVFGQNKDIPSCLLETGPAAFISGPEIVSKMKGCLDRLLGYCNVTSPEALCVLFELIGLICDYCHKNATKDDSHGSGGSFSSESRLYVAAVQIPCTYPHRTLYKYSEDSKSTGTSARREKRVRGIR